MELMLFKNIYAKTGKSVSITDLNSITSDLPKEKAPLYGAFRSSDGSRKLSKILYRTAITIDIDKINGDDLVAKEVFNKITGFLSSNLASWVIHQTHSSAKDNRRFRIIIPIGKVSTKNFPRLAKAFVDDLLTSTGLEDIIEIDNKTYEPQQLMYYLPNNRKIIGDITEQNNIEYWIDLAKNIPEPEPEREQIVFKQSTGFYSFLEQIGMKAIIDNEFSDTYSFIRQLSNGEYEYKYLNSKKKAGVRITEDNQVIVSWHTGDPYMKETKNGVMANNIYGMLKAKGLIDRYLSEYRTTKQ